MKAFCIFSAVSASSNPITAAAGWPCAISRARFGPVNVPNAQGGRSISCRITSVMRFRVCCSSPFVSEIIEASVDTCEHTSRSTSRKACDGIAITTTCAPESASSRSCVAWSEGGSSTPVR
jgi:hypothetical protein